MMKSHYLKHQAQCGGALIIFMLVLVLATTAALISSMNGSKVKIEQDRRTQAALGEAKSALIGYALQHTSKPGALPCTDTNNGGSGVTSGTNACAAYIGRFPWKQLGLPVLKDATGECLWYGLSPIFRNQMTNGNRISNPLNGNTNGTISLLDDADAPMVGVNPVIAVVIAPKGPVSGQSRSGVNTIYCPGDSNASEYLDVKGAVNNATGNVSGTNYTFKVGTADNTFNDQFVYITAQELLPLLRKRIAREILGDVDTPSGLYKYYQTSSSYPCPASTSGGLKDCTISTGFVPYNDPAVGLQYATLGQWLVNNAWFPMTTYDYFSATHVKITLTDALGSYACDANANIVSCSTP